jgi:hypothetical protein
LDEAGVQETDLRGLIPETKEEILNDLKAVFTKLPGTKGAVPAIKADYGMSGTDYAFTVPGDGAIHLNGALYSNLANLKKLYAEDVKGREHPQGTDYHSIVTHETAHSLILMISKRIGTLHVGRLCDKIQQEALESFGLTKDQITEELSGYANETSFDFITEGLTEFLDSKNPRRLARKIGELVRAYVKVLPR